MAFPVSTRARREKSECRSGGLWKSRSYISTCRGGRRGSSPRLCLSVCHPPVRTSAGPASPRAGAQGGDSGVWMQLSDAVPRAASRLGCLAASVPPAPRLRPPREEGSRSARLPPEAGGYAPEAPRTLWNPRLTPGWARLLGAQQQPWPQDPEPGPERGSPCCPHQPGQAPPGEDAARAAQVQVAGAPATHVEPLDGAGGRRALLPVQQHQLLLGAHGCALQHPLQLRGRAAVRGPEARTGLPRGPMLTGRRPGSVTSGAAGPRPGCEAVPTAPGTQEPSRIRDSAKALPAEQEPRRPQGQG